MKKAGDIRHFHEENVDGTISIARDDIMVD